MSQSIRILSTKTLLPNQKQALLEANFEVIEVSFIQTTATDFSLDSVNEHLIFTSQNAVKNFLKHPKAAEFKHKKIFCVGLKTKIMLSEAGYDVVAYAGYAEDLAEIIALIYGNASYTFFSGNLRRNTLPEALQSAGIVFNEIQVYTTTLSPQTMQEKVDGILFFSPSAVESYLATNKIKSEICFCIGESTAEAIEKHKIKNIIVADEPTIESVIDDVIAEYE
jgi:uroporphyrinogen-III synthase